MAKPCKEKNILYARNRHIQGYPKMRNYKMFVSESVILFRGTTEHLNRILEERYGKLSFENQNNLIEQYEKLKQNKKA